MQEIKFYKPKDFFGCGSNFSKHKVVYNGVEYKTSEHAFQTQKFLDEKNRDDVKNASSPSECAKIGRDRKRPLRPDWEKVKNNFMYEIVLAKFQQNADIKKQLLETGDAVLIEHTKNDKYWGDGGDGTGKNQLGKTLMMVREQLKIN